MSGAPRGLFAAEQEKRDIRPVQVRRLRRADPDDLPPREGVLVPQRRNVDGFVSVVVPLE